MIHPNTFACLGETTAQVHPGLSEAWCNLCLTWWWSYPPFGPVAADDIPFRYKMPWTDAEKDGAVRGARSKMYISPSRRGESGLGPDDSDFARDGIPSDKYADIDAPETWGS